MVIPLSSKNSFSLYFHIPFCKRKCDYCHFYVIPDKEEHKALLLKGLSQEWDYWAKHVENYSLTSVYFGGGTPSLFGPERIAEVLSWIEKKFPLTDQQIEVTLEANPENITKTLMEAYHHAGINRVSIGLQSLNDSELALLSRQHDAKTAMHSVEETYAAGIHNISVDLMYDLPAQTISQWKKTLAQVVQLPISHLSLYNLTIEPHTVFYKYRDQLTPKVPNEEDSLSMYTSAIEMLESLGLKQYEISAFAKNGAISKHNTGYWTGRPFLGLGPSAFSYWKEDRFRNVASLHKYMHSLEKKSSPTDYHDQLSPEERRKELLVVALRLIDGVDIHEFEKLNGKLEQETKETLTELIHHHLIECSKDRYSLTKRGVILYDYVASELI